MVYKVVSVLLAFFGMGASGNTPTACYDGWVAFQGNCYLFAGHTSSFVEAEHYCEQQGGHVVEVYSDLENAFIKDELRRTKSTNVWIGATDENTEGSFIWYSSKDPVNYTDWTSAPGEHTAADQDCVIFWTDSDYQWADVWCDYKAEPLCKQLGRAASCISEIFG